MLATRITRITHLLFNTSTFSRLYFPRLTAKVPDGAEALLQWEKKTAKVPDVVGETRSPLPAAPHAGATTVNASTNGRHRLAGISAGFFFFKTWQWELVPRRRRNQG